MRKFYWLIVLCYCLAPHAFAQTVGNGTVIAPSAGELGNYGINGMVSDKTAAAYSTRHYRRGNQAGIGGSFLQTTSPTSDSSPAIKPTSLSPIQNDNAQIRLPNLGPIYPEANTSPALQSSIFATPIRSTALNNPLTSSSSFSNPSLDSLSSFSKQPSLMDKMQFNTFGSSGKLGF